MSEIKFTLRYTPTANDALDKLAKTDPKKLARVNVCLSKLQSNPRYGSLNSHKYAQIKGPNGEDVWESYVENRTPAAWRVFWCYGPASDEITVIAVTPHP